MYVLKIEFGLISRDIFILLGEYQGQHSTGTGLVYQESDGHVHLFLLFGDFLSIKGFHLCNQVQGRDSGSIRVEVRCRA